MFCAISRLEKAYERLQLDPGAVTVGERASIWMSWFQQNAHQKHRLEGDELRALRDLLRAYKTAKRNGAECFEHLSLSEDTQIACMQEWRQTILFITSETEQFQRHAC